MISTITVDLVNGTKFHYLKGKSDIEGFKNVKLKLYYNDVLLKTSEGYKEFGGDD